MAAECKATLVIATHDQRIRARIPRHFELKAAA
jgi:predicted ABC-type transport system involved in lysophospholipase L1 biosynthesis ATPase subunit